MVGVGAAFMRKIAKTTYTFSAYSTHGCYMITNAGYTYSEYDSTINSQIGNWGFGAKETIKVTIDPKIGKVIFEKEGKDPYQMSYDSKEDGELNFTVLLCQKNDSVEIMYA